MGYGYTSDHTGVRIEWTFEGIDSNEDIPRPNNGIDFLMDRFRPEICDEFLLGVINDNEWDEFKAGLSMTADRVESVVFKYYPLQRATLTIIKRCCPKCHKPCGWAIYYCDGTGKSTGKCSDCGTTDHNHKPDCVYSS